MQKQALAWPFSRNQAGSGRSFFLLLVVSQNLQANSKQDCFFVLFFSLFFFYVLRLNWMTSVRFCPSFPALWANLTSCRSLLLIDGSLCFLVPCLIRKPKRKARRNDQTSNSTAISAETFRQNLIQKTSENSKERHFSSTTYTSTRIGKVCY